MRKIQLLLLVLISSIPSFAQTAIIKARKVFPDIKEKTNFIQFNCNGQQFGEKDTLIAIRLNKNGWDKCTAIINSDTLTFYTKFKENETYEIEQGCCCAAFTLTPNNNPRRGTVEFRNKEKRSLGIVVSESNQITVGSKKKKRLFASESAMCTFKPCKIQIVETSYFSERFHYDQANGKKLKAEQDKLELASTYFHFLNGEKIRLEYDPEKNKIEMVLDGYLTEAEYNKEF